MGCLKERSSPLSEGVYEQEMYEDGYEDGYENGYEEEYTGADEIVFEEAEE